MLVHMGVGEISGDRGGPADDGRRFGRASAADHVRLCGQRRLGAVGLDPSGNAAKRWGRWLSERCPDGDGEFALQGCTGWRYVSEELAAASVGDLEPEPVVVEPAQT